MWELGALCKHELYRQPSTWCAAAQEKQRVQALGIRFEPQPLASAAGAGIAARYIAEYVNQPQTSHQSRNSSSEWFTQH
jgi:hypothetical protein